MGFEGDSVELVEAYRRHVPVPDIELHVAEAVEVENLTFDPSPFDGRNGDAKLSELPWLERLTELVERQPDSRCVLRPGRARRGHGTTPALGSTRCSRT